MKKTVIAAAVLAASAGAAQAQNVTIYGIVDTGLEYQSKVATGSGDDSRFSMQNGGILPSIWGFKGSEDLGGGLKAVFNLEGDFGADTGGPRFGGALMLFGRQANVGLSGGFGTVLLGRQYSPAILAELGTDPRGYKESFSSLLPYALAQNPAGNGITGNNFLGIFTGNMISYTNAFGPVTLRAGYGLGEVAGENSDATTIALGLTYAGPVTVSGTFQQIKGAGGTDAETQRVGLGVAVPFGGVTLKGLFAMTKADDVGGTEVSDATLFGVGVDWAWNPMNTLTVAWYQGDDDMADGKTNDLVISNDYAISKRTVIYAQFVYADVDSGANVGLSIAADRGPIAGEKTSILGLGIKHSF
jgi:predicted porin